MVKNYVREPYKEIIITKCMSYKEADPVNLACEIMECDGMRMHGPEHHFLVAAVLMTVYNNVSKEEVDLEQQLAKLHYRTNLVMEGTCGFYGVCGDVMGVGAFFSLLKKVTPYSDKAYRRLNEIVADCQRKMTEYNGPRCCKRATFLCLLSAIESLNCDYNLEIPIPTIYCTFFRDNDSCQGMRCPFFHLEKMCGKKRERSESE